MNPDDIKGMLHANTPKARLDAHLVYWADNPTPYIQELLDALQAQIDARGSIGAKGLLMLAKLDNLRTQKQWNDDSDMKRGERQLQGASKGGKTRAVWPQHQEEMQQLVNEIFQRHPSWSYEDIKRQANKEGGFPLHALKRYTKNPRTK